MTTLCVTENTTCQNGSPDSTVTGVADSWMNVFDTAATNHTDTLGRTARFAGNEERNMLLEFDVSGIGASQTVTSAELWMFLNLDSTSTAIVVDVFEIQRAMVIGQASWADYATSTAWGTAGAKATADRGAAAVATFSLGVDPAHTTYYSVDVTAEVAAAYAASSPLRLLMALNSSTGNEYVEWRMSENTDGNRPELFVTHSAAGGASTGRTPVIKQHYRNMGYS